MKTNIESNIRLVKRFPKVEIANTAGIYGTLRAISDAAPQRFVKDYSKCFEIATEMILGIFPDYLFERQGRLNAEYDNVLLGICISCFTILEPLNLHYKSLFSSIKEIKVQKKPERVVYRQIDGIENIVGIIDKEEKRENIEGTAEKCLSFCKKIEHKYYWYSELEKLVKSIKDSILTIEKAESNYCFLEGHDDAINCISTICSYYTSSFNCEEK